MNAKPIIASLAAAGELVPAPSDQQVHRLLTIGVVIRWVLIAVIAAGGMLTPRAVGSLFYLLGLSAVYNGAVMLVLARAPLEWSRRIAFGVTSVDQLFCITFIGMYTNLVPGSQPLGGYAMAVIEAVAYFGSWGGLLSIGTFLAGVLVVETFHVPFGTLFDGPGLVNTILLLGGVAISMTATLHIRAAGVRGGAVDGQVAATSNGHGAVRLTKREREVLQLVAEGYSNSMIARRLELSESTVKSYVENLLFHLNVRNRAEAVAAASRLRLI